MDTLDQYILSVIASFPLKRKPAFLFAIVTGKRTGQAVQDAHLFEVTPLFGCLPTLRQRSFDARLAGLQELGWIEVTEDGIALVPGIASPFQTQFPYIDGFLYQNRTNRFFERLLLAIQVFSNFKHERKNYLPIVRDEETQLAVKYWLATHLAERSKEVARADLFSELERWLMDADASLFVPRFSGGDYIGKTALQVAELTGREPWNYYFAWLNGLHQLFGRLDQGFPLLAGLMPSAEEGLTTSARKTLQLAEQGVPFDKMMTVRHLKWSTIQDHIVEMAATIPAFDISEWVDEATVLRIGAQGWQSLKEIKQAFPELDYFQIRLALIAKRSGATCS
ncbi:hypothetical protein HB852_02220 [Listeria grandensis]|uniref:helix-turn-helix domain-containing protein n=1 Tax=Listeria grandensis TaxID=1494963 RepID=UPI001625F836|nr:helix-turn-helix domain-containing protein [Listeria grandensis]MBC1473436.1 hypothetical protein [Listeria grandensis]